MRKVAEEAAARMMRAINGDEGSGIRWSDDAHQQPLADMVELMRALDSAGIIDRSTYARLDSHVAEMYRTHPDFWDPVTTFWLAWIGHRIYDGRHRGVARTSDMLQVMDEAARDGVWVDNRTWKRLLRAILAEAESGAADDPAELERMLCRARDEDSLAAWGIELTDSDRNEAVRVERGIERLRERLERAA